MSRSRSAALIFLHHRIELRLISHERALRIRAWSGSQRHGDYQPTCRSHRRSSWRKSFSSLVDEGAGGITTAVLAGAIRARGGWQVSETRGTPDILLREIQLGRPVIALIEDRRGVYHYVVVVASGGGRMVVHDPARVPFRTIEASEFDRRWAAAKRWMLVVTPAGQPAGSEGVPADASADTQPLRVGDVSPDGAVSSGSTTCEQLVADGVRQAQGGDLAAAERTLVSATRGCRFPLVANGRRRTPVNRLAILGEPSALSGVARGPVTMARGVESQRHTRAATVHIGILAIEPRFSTARRRRLGHRVGALAARGRRGSLEQGQGDGDDRHRRAVSERRQSRRCARSGAPLVWRWGLIPERAGAADATVLVGAGGNGAGCNRERECRHGSDTARLVVWRRHWTCASSAPARASDPCRGRTVPHRAARPSRRHHLQRVAAMVEGGSVPPWRRRIHGHSADYTTDRWRRHHRCGSRHRCSGHPPR